MTAKIIKAEEVPALIKDGATIAVEGFLGAGVAEEIHEIMGKHYEETKSPKNLTLLYAAGIGDGKELGMNHYAKKGLVKRVIGGHFGLAPKFQPLIANNEVEAYNFPQGVVSQMFREMAAKKPFLLSRVGLGTYVDPELEGGKLNSVTTEDLVEKISFNGDEFLAYKLPKLDVAILRGTLADENGNISMVEEPLTLEATSMATAAKNMGGIVIVQVKHVVKNGSLNPKSVRIPGLLVDYIVVASDESKHKQTYATQFNADFITSNVVPEAASGNMRLDERKIIARRCAQLIPKDAKILNYGIGMPEGIASVLKEEGINGRYTTTIEPGCFGGVAQGGMDFGTAISPDSIIDQSLMFDFYDGGGIDAAFLGLAECDQTGNINVSKFGPKVAGCGGFINITQNTNVVVFCGTFKAGGLKVATEDGKLTILNEGRAQKFVDKVEQITFSSKTALKNKQQVYYVTERAVFKLTDEGVELIEIAPGIDLEKDVLAHMSFKPIMHQVGLMDERIFRDVKMNLS